MANKQHRRRFLRATALATAGFLAGCAGQTTTTRSDPSNTDTTSFPPTSASAESKSSSTSADTSPTAADDQSVQHNHQNTDNPEFSKETLSKAQTLGETVQKSVVELTDGGRGGTGWIIADGYIMTNSHVVYDSETMDVETFEGDTGTATRVGYHRDMVPDIALMKTDMETPEPLTVNSDVQLSKGDPVLMVGHPGSVGRWVISLGRYDSFQKGVNWVLSDIPTKQGNSGSPLLSLNGDVIACVSGETTMGRGDGRVDRPSKVYTEFPDPERKTTGAPSKSVEKWFTEWK